MNDLAASRTATPETVGQAAGKIPVELSSRFLEQFSEQLYSSPQKAFEELISNSWDAGADCVDVRISEDLSAQTATMTVLDNGASMNDEGLRELWHIAFSPKKNKPTQYGRRAIGQFGIGKLATYLLARRVTYICKAADGKIRRVTMDYEDVERHGGSVTPRLISEIQLDMFDVPPTDLEGALKSIQNGQAVIDLLKGNVPRPAGSLGEDQFGALPGAVEAPPKGTWTLVILSGLKPIARNLKIGVLRRMLVAALPFGTTMAISINGELLQSPKMDVPIFKEWTIGPDLNLTSIEIAEDDAGSVSATEVKLVSKATPRPHLEIPGIGVITGRVWLFDKRVSGTKSDDNEASNGFHVNVLGRVINQRDPSFGEKNLSHAAWSKFRMTVRADGLNELLTTDREKLREKETLQVFRAFLRKVFNFVRTFHDADQVAAMPDGGDVLLKSLGVVSLAPLVNVVSDTLESEPAIPGLFDDTGIPDREEKRRSWKQSTADNIANALSQVKYERMDDDSFVKFRISDSSIVVNKEHPFVDEHSHTRAEKELMRTVAMVSLLTDVYALDIGIAANSVDDIRKYRDRLMRFRAMQRRQSGTHIAKLLVKMAHDSGASKRLEVVLSDALRYLGFDVRDIAKSGEPEGVASAYATPTNAEPTTDDPNPPLYKFTFDAKSSKWETASTGNIKLDGIVEHRERYKADYALVVAPGFEEGAITTRCEQQEVTPMCARDLGKLLEYTVEFGAIPLTKLREVFQLRDPKKVSDWVEALGPWLKGKRPMTIAIFIGALRNLKGQVPDVLPAGTIALECRKAFKAVGVKEEDVLAIARGLEILVPDLVGVERGDKIVVSASADHLAQAVKAQLEKLHSANGDDG